jgi:hypothetical protein
MPDLEMDGSGGASEAGVEQKVKDRETTLIRLAGLLGLFSTGLYIVINFALMAFPSPTGLPLEQLKTYISDHAGAMAAANGLRYLALFCIPFVAVGLHLLTRGGAKPASNGWSILGVIGGVGLLTMGIIANTIQAMAFLPFADPSERPEQFMLLWNLSRLLFRAAQLLTGLMILGFSIAGWQSAIFPSWLAVVGLLFAASGLFTSVFMAWTMSDSSVVEPVLMTRDVLALFWGLCTNVIMLLKPSRRLTSA